MFQISDTHGEGVVYLTECDHKASRDWALAVGEHDDGRRGRRRRGWAGEDQGTSGTLGNLNVSWYLDQQGTLPT